MKQHKTPWDHRLEPVTKQVIMEPMALEVRENKLNQRLLDNYYGHQHNLLKRKADQLQRPDSQEH